MSPPSPDVGVGDACGPSSSSSGWWWSDLYDETQHPAAVGLWRLNDTEGNTITPDSHTSCAGHVALIDDYHGDQVSYLCADPAAYGHTEKSRVTDTTSSGGGMTEEQKAERRTVVANNRAALAATDVRLRYLNDLLKGKTPPAGTLRFVTEFMVRHGSTVSDATAESTAAVLGVEAQHGRYGTNPVMDQLLTDATDRRLPLVGLAQIAAGIEAHWHKGFWRNPSASHAAYLTFLASTGYEASAVEQIVINHFAPKTAKG